MKNKNLDNKLIEVWTHSFLNEKCLWEEYIRYMQKTVFDITVKPAVLNIFKTLIHNGASVYVNGEYFHGEKLLSSPELFINDNGLCYVTINNIVIAKDFYLNLCITIPSHDPKFLYVSANKILGDNTQLSKILVSDVDDISLFDAISSNIVTVIDLQMK